MRTSTCTSSTVVVVIGVEEDAVRRFVDLDLRPFGAALS